MGDELTPLHEIIRREIETYGFREILAWAESTHPGLLDLLAGPREVPVEEEGKAISSWAALTADGPARRCGAGRVDSTHAESSEPPEYTPACAMAA